MKKAFLDFGRFVNRVLRPARIKIQRFNPNAPVTRKVPLWRYEKVLREYHDYLVETVFSHLPLAEGRLELLEELEGQGVCEALLILGSLHRTLDKEGDVCEFGCAAGATSALLANEIRTTDKTLWIFDSFQGLPKPTQKDHLLDDFWSLGSMEAYEGTMSYSPEMVKSKLDRVNFPASRVNIISGFIEQTLHLERVPEKISFALVDVDFYVPVLTALLFLRERLTIGGRIVVDDYGTFSSGAKTAVDEFVASYSDCFSTELPPHGAGHSIILTKHPLSHQ